MPELAPSPEGVPGAVSDVSNLRAEDLTFVGARGETVDGYLARPADGGPNPAMIVIHEAGGLGEHIRDVANRLANIGYVTLAPDLYTREGGPPDTNDMQKVLARLFSMEDAVVQGDLEGAATYLLDRPETTDKLGCIGFCFGGRHALLLAASTEKLSAAVDCWGGFIDKATTEEHTTPQRPVPPLDMAAQVRCPLYAAIGAEDHNPSLEIGERLREQLAKSGQEFEVEVYEGAGHAFFADYRPTYRPKPAAELWERIVPFLERHLR
jgi:carboxymethylenebutenolidase